MTEKKPNLGGWICAGLLLLWASTTADADDPPTDSPPSQIAAKDLWSLQPLNVAPPPEGTPPIDGFIHARREAAGLPPAKPAAPPILLRRLFLTLTGLPPTPADLSAFETELAEDREAALEKWVDQLLASPGFGDRWGRHWLDLSAYADTVGIGRPIPAPEAWRYRDYVIKAFNQDKHFDQFIREQLAGDIQTPPAPGVPAGPEPTAESITATGFLAIGPWELVSGDKVQLRMDVVDRQVYRTGRAFLGMTFDCARCHDHKFDPISQHDYYALAGMFKSTVTLDGRINGVFSAILHRALPETADELIARAEQIKHYLAEVARETQQGDRAKAKVAALNKEISDLEADLAEVVTNEDRSEDVERLTAWEKEVSKQEAAIKTHDGRLSVLSYLKHHRTENRAMAVRDAPEPENCRLNIRGSAHQLGAEVPRGFPSEIAPREPPSFTRGGSGRVQLAAWIAHEQNPLAARVWVNRVWHHVFGTGLVRTVDNFGSRGEAPSHPDLLDYLANAFMKQGWSTKQLIRTMVLTRSWQQASVNPDALAQSAAEKDPENRLLWRAHRQRLEAEALRDSLLFISGKLDPGRSGPSLPLDIPGNLDTGSTGILKENLRIPPAIKYRRTVYLPQQRKAPFDEIDFIGAFNLPDTNQETGKRDITAVPAQAMYLANSDLMWFCAWGLMDRHLTGTPEERVAGIYRAVLLRDPSDDEQRTSRAFIQEMEVALKAAGKDYPTKNAWARFCHALFMTNEFLFRS